MLSVLQCYHEMHFEMFTEHEFELFALHKNFSFQFVCSTQIKMYQESGFLGAFFGTVYCRITGASWGFSPWTPPGLFPGSTGELIAPPDNQLLQTMKYGHCMSYFRQDTTFIHTLTTNLARHSKFL